MKGGEKWFQEIQVGIVGNRAVYDSCFRYIVKLEEILMVFVLLGEYDRVEDADLLSLALSVL